VAKLCGAAFVEHALTLSFEAADLQLAGWIGAPGYSRGVADVQYFFVNGRMVRDNLLRHAVRHAHHGIVENGRQPAYVLYLNISPAEVDVNVHPSKHEVRFRDARSVHDFVVRSLRQALSMESDAGDSPVGDSARFTAAQPLSNAPGYSPGHSRVPVFQSTIREHTAAYDHLRTHSAEQSRAGAPALGEALQHIDRRYVVSRNNHGLVVVDARRACRRVAAARLQAALENDTIVSRPLLVPVTVAIDEAQADLLEFREQDLERLGFDLRRVAKDRVSCRGVPAPLAAASPNELVHCVAGAIGADEPPAAFPALLKNVLAHCDLTAGWAWDLDTMNDLLRQLERLESTCDSQPEENIWRQVNAADMAALLEAPSL
jgi:DNA mismatch repair protein MutL